MLYIYIYTSAQNIIYVNEAISEIKGHSKFPRLRYITNLVSNGFPMVAQHMQVDMSSNLMAMYASLPWGDTWDDAAASAIVRYLRGSKLVKIPPEWKPLLPAEL